MGSLLALAVARLGLKGVGRRLVALLQAGTDLVPGCHDSRLIVRKKLLMHVSIILVMTPVYILVLITEQI